MINVCGHTMTDLAALDDDVLGVAVDELLQAESRVWNADACPDDRAVPALTHQEDQ